MATAMDPSHVVPSQRISSSGGHIAQPPQSSLGAGMWGLAKGFIRHTVILLVKCPLKYCRWHFPERVGAGFVNYVTLDLEESSLRVEGAFECHKKRLIAL